MSHVIYRLFNPFNRGASRGDASTVVQVSDQRILPALKHF